MRHIGVTGTREGMTPHQMVEVGRLLSRLVIEGPHTLHHGDCVGVDIQVARIASKLGMVTVCHPPIDQSLRAFHESTETLAPLGYLARDRKIVESCEFLIVVPKHHQWQATGGTWYTHDYSVRRGVPRMIIWPTADSEHPQES